MTIDRVHVAVEGPVDDAELDAVHASASGSGPAGVPWNRRLRHHSLFWVTARSGDKLVGFVNVIGDGGAHAVLLDTCVSPDRQGEGIGRELVRVAAQEARHRGSRWLHADYLSEHASFYEDACGLRPTRAGLLDLTPSTS
ncbi:GNAT family N-acetyltransferase [Ornithinimicrobium sp. Y1694]|uniref:GNAT family N-acetyltransferase n=1 Tax=Ornithinimicrobium sp. Y1694 TaxID=3418590 RepID=UPI003CED28D7